MALWLLGNLGYINPHLVRLEGKEQSNSGRSLYEEARSRGYLIKTPEGLDYKVRLGVFESGMIDLFKPEARLWLKSIIKEQLLGIGLSGWMCDFSESLPSDASFADGRSGSYLHNLYVEEWAKLNQEAIEEAGVRDDAVFFCRAGYTRSPRYARFFWQGDQMVSWDRFDGLRSAVVGLIGGGISGYSLNHSDIGGYANLNVGSLGIVRDKELLARWEEFSAFTAAFRTHEGLRPEANAQVYDDEESLTPFARNARLFKSLQPYRKILFQEAEAKGYPVVRALFLQYHDDPKAYELDDEFMLGSEILVAPILEKKARAREVYLPKGQWVHVWSRKTYGSPDQPTELSIAAPIGEPPVFVRAGSQQGEEWLKTLDR